MYKKCTIGVKYQIKHFCTRYIFEIMLKFAQKVFFFEKTLAKRAKIVYYYNVRQITKKVSANPTVKKLTVGR